MAATLSSPASLCAIPGTAADKGPSGLSLAAHGQSTHQGLRLVVKRSPAVFAARDSQASRKKTPGVVRCDWDANVIGGDLLGFDLGRWYDDVEKHKGIAFYAPPEGGTEGRYATRLKNKGYHFMNISARGLGDPEAYLTKVHGVRPPHLGKQAIARWYIPPELDYRLAALPKSYKGIVLWVGEAKVLARNELQYLALLPSIRPNVRVIAEMGGSRKFQWKPLKVVAGLTDVVETATS